MDINEFIQHFAELFDETAPCEFTSQTVFHDLDEYSSLMALSIIAMINEEYDVTLKGNDLSAAVTLEDLFNIVKSKI